MVSDVYIAGVTVVGLSEAEGTDVLILVVKPFASSLQVPVVCETVTTAGSSELEMPSDRHGVVASPGGGATTVDDTEAWASERTRADVSSAGHGVVASPGGGATVVNDAEAWDSEETMTEANVLGASGAGPAGEIKPPVCCASGVEEVSEEVRDSGASESTEGSGIEVACDVKAEDS